MSKINNAGFDGVNQRAVAALGAGAVALSVAVAAAGFPMLASTVLGLGITSFAFLCLSKLAQQKRPRPVACRPAEK